MTSNTTFTTTTTTETNIMTTVSTTSTRQRTDAGADTNTTSSDFSSSSDSVKNTTSSDTATTTDTTADTATSSSTSKTSSSSSKTSTTDSTTTSETTTTSSSTTTTTPSTNSTTSSTTAESTTATPPPQTSPTDTGQSVSTEFATLTTSIDGQPTTLTTPLPPTALSQDNSTHANLNRTALIAGTTIGSVLLVCAILGVLFFYKRHQARRMDFVKGLARGRREGKGAGGIGLLDAEFDDDDNVPLSRYLDNPAIPTSSSVPSLFRARASDSGSIFRENIDNDVRFVDPFVESVGSKVNLSSIVDDVMGPPPAPVPPVHDRSTPTGAHISVASAGSLYTDPFRDASQLPAQGSVYYYNPTSSSLPQVLQLPKSPARWRPASNPLPIHQNPPPSRPRSHQQ